MRNYLRRQIRYVETLTDFPEPQENWGNELAELLLEVKKRAALEGLPAIVDLCIVRESASPRYALRVLSQCLACCDQSTTPKKLLTVREASGEFNVSQRTLYRMIENKQLPTVKARGAIRIKPADLEACLEQHLDKQVTESLFDLAATRIPRLLAG
jgi:excisionase family DNA binding protein